MVTRYRGEGHHTSSGVDSVGSFARHTQRREGAVVWGLGGADTAEFECRWVRWPLWLELVVTQRVKGLNLIKLAAGGVIDGLRNRGGKKEERVILDLTRTHSTGSNRDGVVAESNSRIRLTWNNAFWDRPRQGLGAGPSSGDCGGTRTLTHREHAIPVEINPATKVCRSALFHALDAHRNAIGLARHHGKARVGAPHAHAIVVLGAHRGRGNR